MRRTWAVLVLLLAGCGSHGRPDYAHVEVFAHGRVVLIPAGTGITGGRRVGAYVVGGRPGPLSTDEPTGLVALRRAGLTLGDLYAAWGRPLRGATVHVNGRLWRGPTRAVPLRHHDQVVVQEGYAPILPHSEYMFPPGH